MGSCRLHHTGVFQPRAYTREGRGKCPLVLSHFSNLKLKSKEHRKLVCCSFSALRKLYRWTRATLTEVQMKNLSRMHIHPNQVGAIRDSKVKQL